jgi:putative salt-induced outer membrane protein YdiY
VEQDKGGIISIMSYRSNVLVFFILSSFYLLSGRVNADEVLFDNGDRITGKIISMEQGKLIITTSYAGDISVAWEEVAGLKADSVIKIILDDDTLIQGITLQAEEGSIKLETGRTAEPVSFDLVDVKAINPGPDVIEPEVRITALFNLGVNAARGNTETESQHFDGEFVARTEKNRYTVGAELNTAEDKGEKTANDLTGYLKYDHFLDEKWFFYSNALFEKDIFRDINLRTAMGLGAGYQFLEKPLINLSGELGLSYINEDLENAPDKGYNTGRWALNLDRYLFQQIIQFFHFHEGFIGFEDMNDILIRSRTGFRIPLYKSLNATLQFNYDWDKVPSPGRKKTDKMYILNLGYQFDSE